MNQFSLLSLMFLISLQNLAQELAYSDFSISAFNNVNWQTPGNVHAVCPPFLGSNTIVDQEYFVSSIVTGQEINPSRFFSMKMGIDGCNQMRIDSLKWRAKNYSSIIVDSPFKFHLRSSLDDFTDDLAVFTVAADWQWMSYHPLAGLMDSVHNIEFRIYFTDAQILINTWESANAVRIDDFYVYGFQSNSDTLTYYLDGDGDNYGDPLYAYHDCNFTFPYHSIDSTDCNPENVNINPATFWMRDYDQDGYYNYFDRQQSCEQPDPSYILVYDQQMDCDDSASNVHFDAYENPCPDSLDADCDGSDQGMGIMPHCNFHMDGDGDGYGDGVVNNLPCCPASVQYYLDQGYVGYSGLVDCDDGNALIHPLAVEIPGNNVDENCDGSLLVGVSESEKITLVLKANPSVELMFLPSPNIDISCSIMIITDMRGRSIFKGKVVDFLNHNGSSSWEMGCYHIQLYHGEIEQSLKWIKV